MESSFGTPSRQGILRLHCLRPERRVQDWFQRLQVPPSKDKRETNVKSALEQPQIVLKYVRDEYATRSVVGPLAVNKFRDTDLMISCFGVIPKGSTGKWRMIVDLSFPEGSSVNDGIEADICSLHYAKVEEVTEGLVKQGRNSWMTKVDIKSAYWTVLVHPRIGGFWACNGTEPYLWIQHCHSG